MPFTTTGKNRMLDQLAAVLSHAGLFDEAAAITTVTGAEATDLLTKAGHGLSNGQTVVLRSLVGGTGLVTEHLYFVVGVAGDDFQLAKTSGGAAINFTVDITSVSVVRLVEISGGAPAYARQAMAWNVAAGGTVDDSGTPIFDVPAGATVNYVGYFTAVSGGTCHAIAPLVTEVYGGQGTYTLTDTDLDLLGDE